MTYYIRREGSSFDELTVEASNDDPGTAFPYQEWTHVALVHTRTSLGATEGHATLYWDLVEKASDPSLFWPLPVGRSGLYVGRSHWSNDPLFVGTMRDLMMWDVALTPSQLADVRDGIRGPPIAPLVEAMRTWCPMPLPPPPAPPPPPPPALSPPPPPSDCRLDFLSYDASTQTYVPVPDGTLVAEFTLMERFATDAIRRDTYDGYWCELAAAPHLACLDIAAPSTFGRLVGASALAIQNASAVNHSRLFGQEAVCADKVVGDGVVNVFDMSTLLHAIFQDAPYAGAALGATTVGGRDDLACRADARGHYARGDPCSAPSPARRRAAAWAEQGASFGTSRSLEASAATWHVLDLAGHVVYQLQLIFHDASYAVDAEGFGRSTPEARARCVRDGRPCLLVEYACEGAAEAAGAARFESTLRGSHVVRNGTGELHQMPLARACPARFHIYAPRACLSLKSVLASTHRGAVYLRGAGEDACLERAAAPAPPAAPSPAAPASPAAPPSPAAPAGEAAAGGAGRRGALCSPSSSRRSPSRWRPRCSSTGRPRAAAAPRAPSRAAGARVRGARGGGAEGEKKGGGGGRRPPASSEARGVRPRWRGSSSVGGRGWASGERACAGGAGTRSPSRAPVGGAGVRGVLWRADRARAAGRLSHHRAAGAGARGAAERERAPRGGAVLGVAEDGVAALARRPRRVAGGVAEGGRVALRRRRRRRRVERHVGHRRGWGGRRGWPVPGDFFSARPGHPRARPMSADTLPFWPAGGDGGDDGDAEADTFATSSARPRRSGLPDGAARAGGGGSAPPPVGARPRHRRAAVGEYGGDVPNGMGFDDDGVRAATPSRRPRTRGTRQGLNRAATQPSAVPAAMAQARGDLYHGYNSLRCALRAACRPPAQPRRVRGGGRRRRARVPRGGAAALPSRCAWPRAVDDHDRHRAAAVGRRAVAPAARADGRGEAAARGPVPPRRMSRRSPRRAAPPPRPRARPPPARRHRRRGGRRRRGRRRGAAGGGGGTRTARSRAVPTTGTRGGGDDAGGGRARGRRLAGRRRRPPPRRRRAASRGSGPRAAAVPGAADRSARATRPPCRSRAPPRCRWRAAAAPWAAGPAPARARPQRHPRAAAAGASRRDAGADAAAATRAGAAPTMPRAAPEARLQAAQPVRRRRAQAALRDDPPRRASSRRSAARERAPDAVLDFAARAAVRDSARARAAAGVAPAAAPRARDAVAGCRCAAAAHRGGGRPAARAAAGDDGVTVAPRAAPHRPAARMVAPGRSAAAQRRRRRATPAAPTAAAAPAAARPAARVPPPRNSDLRER